MPWNGSGVFTRNYSWVADKNASIDITASRTDADTDDITTDGLGLCVTRDGQGSAQANLPMNGFKFTNLGPGSAAGDSVNFGQLSGFAPLNGTGTSGTWPISISGNAATATSATSATTATSASSATTATTASTANALNTGNNYQMNSLGVGTSAPGGGSINATGTITQAVSDDRLKTRLGPIEDPIGKLMSLSGFYYQHNELAKSLGVPARPGREIGLSAQDVYKVLPELVAPAPIDHEYMTLRYERFAAFLVEVCKAQQLRIESIESRLTA